MKRAPKSVKLDQRYLNHLAKLVREEIKKRGVSDAQFARDVDVPQSQLSSMLRADATGRGIGIVGLISIRDALKVSLDELLGLEPVSVPVVRLDPVELDAAIEAALARRESPKPKLLPPAVHITRKS